MTNVSIVDFTKKIIFQVHDCIEACNNKEEDAQFPVTKVLHLKIMEYLVSQDIDPWSFMTTYRVLISLGFK